MTKRERELLVGIFEVTNTIGSLTPQNPADLKAITHNLPTATRAAKATASAISNLGYGDFDLCADYIDVAKRILAAPDGVIAAAGEPVEEADR